MENHEKTHQTKKEYKRSCGCFEPTSFFGKMMMKTMKKMCGSQNNEQFDCESMINGMNCCYESKSAERNTNKSHGCGCEKTESDSQINTINSDVNIENSCC